MELKEAISKAKELFSILEDVYPKRCRRYTNSD